MAPTAALADNVRGAWSAPFSWPLISAHAVLTPDGRVLTYGTDGNGFRPRGVKTYGFFPGVIPAASILSMHGDAEFMPIDALGPAIQILFEALKETASR